ncbi:MAG: hypothetical protein ABJG68_00310 [Crocinitomicaceae bacterium]
MKNSFLITLLFIISNHLSFSQSKLLLENEHVLFSFKTIAGKTCMIAHEKTNEKYLVYRYGTAEHIELEYPKDKSNSWSKFTYEFYYRGGGKENLGLDINSLSFENGNYRYSVYQDYSAENESYSCGINVTNLTSKKITQIKGVYFSAQGGLNLLRDSIHRDEIEK